MLKIVPSRFPRLGKRVHFVVALDDSIQGVLVQNPKTETLTTKAFMKLIVLLDQCRNLFVDFCGRAPSSLPSRTTSALCFAMAT